MEGTGLFLRVVCSDQPFVSVSPSIQLTKSVNCAMFYLTPMVNQIVAGRRIIIHSIFKNLKSEKQERIINAAIKEFVQSGFEKASTNKIVKGANISKGSLFHYFHSKKDLYFYLIEYSVQIVEQIYEQIDVNEPDIFKRIEKLGLKKLHIQRKFPQVFDFLTSCVQEESDEVKVEIKHKIHLIFEKGFEKLYGNIDYSKFREGIDVQKAIDILNWTMLGFAERAIHQFNTFEDIGQQYIKEWESYSNVLKRSFYKCDEEI